MMHVLTILLAVLTTVLIDHLRRDIVRYTWSPWPYWSFGYTHDRVEHGALGASDPEDRSVYMERWIVWVGRLTLRLHKFYRGDDDSAPHDHPWWFITFPLKSYGEMYWERESAGCASVWACKTRVVKAFRFHYRPATHRHFVILPGNLAPLYTLVIGGGHQRKWGFWPTPTNFVYWRDWVKRGEIPGDQP